MHALAPLAALAAAAMPLAHAVALPTAPFIGVSAMTGDVSDNHDVIAITTFSALLSSPDAPRDPRCLDGLAGSHGRTRKEGGRGSG